VTSAATTRSVRFVAVSWLGEVRRTLRPAVAGLLLVVLLGACGWTDREPDYGTPPDEPVVIESAPAAAVAEINWDRPIHPSGFYEGDEWPPACDLLTDEEITAVLPQATVTDRAPEDQEFDVIVVGGLGGHFVARDSECTIELDIPQAGLPNDAEFDRPPTITITVDAAGTSGIVATNVHPLGERVQTTAGECYSSDFGGVMCRLDQMAFRLVVDLPIQQAGSGGYTNRYQVADGTTTFTDRDSEMDEVQRQEEAFLRSALYVPLTELVLAKA
jgi:hypothetical protein